MLCVIDDGPLSDDRKAMHTKVHGKQVTQKWKWVSTGNNLRGGTKTNVIRLTLDWKGLKNIWQKGYKRSVVYVYHSKIQTEKQTTVSLKGVGTCCGNWWEDRPKHQDSFMEELHFLIQV